VLGTSVNGARRGELYSRYTYYHSYYYSTEAKAREEGELQAAPEGEAGGEKPPEV
jgi:hypothetical protein